MFNSDNLQSLKDLASAVGIPGTALLILCLGIAYHLPKLATTLRQILKDCLDHSRKSNELDHRIRRESASIGVEIARKNEQLVKRIGGKAGK